MIEVTGCGGNNGCTPSSGDFAQAVLNVVSGPKITLSPATGQPGAHILVNGTGFLPTDTSCTVTSVGFDINGHSPMLSGTAACAIRVGSGLVNGSFSIGNVLPGQYVIEVTGCGGNNGCTPSSGDFAQAVLNVVSGPKITLTPSTARTGAHILVNGTGFLPTDTSCSVSGPIGPNGPSEVIVPGTAGCAINAGTGVVSASFIVSNVQPGQYVIEVTACLGNNGCAPSAGDFAQAVLYVVTGPSIGLSPGSDAPGAHVEVNGTGFLPSDTTCVLVSGSSNLVDPILAGTAACVIHEGTGLVNASFTVGNVPPGQYVIEVDAFSAIISTVTTTLSTTTTTTSTTATTSTFTSTTNLQIDTAQAILNVVGGPKIGLSPATGQPGAHILVNGTGFLPTDTSCTVSAVGFDSNGHSPLLSGTAACVVRVGSGIVNGSFTIGNVLPGQYVIEVTGCSGNNGCNPSSGDFAQALLNVVSGPKITLSPATGQPGAHVLVNGTGFLPTDTSCTLSAVGFDANGHSPMLSGTAACVIRAGSGVVNGSFTIGNVLPGQYIIEITGCLGNNGCSPSSGDFAQALLNVVKGPSIKLSPASARTGAHILVNGTGFLPTDTSCTVSAVGFDSNGHSPLLSGTAACAISVGSGIVNASFTIGNVLPGQYVIEITGCLGNNGCSPSVGDFAQALLNVVSGPKIGLSPATGQPGAHILVNGTGFLPTDTSCTISAVGLDSNGHSPMLSGTAACAISVGSGLVNGSFTIGNVLPGQYVIEITGCGGNNGCIPSSGDFAQAVLNVVKGPAIRLSPASARTGAHILVNGTGFLPTDTSCTISAVGLDSNGHSPMLSGTAACAISVGSGLVNGSFTIGNVLPGQYVIEITGCGGNNGCTPSVGDFAQAVLDVVSGPKIGLSPATGQPGAHILINGTGFLPTDTSCTVSAVGLDSNGHSPLLSGTAGCVISVGSGIVNGSFTIGNVLPGQYVIEVTGCGGNNGCTPSVGDFAQALLNVVSGPKIRLSPATGQPGAHILVNGTGFLPTDTSCTLSSVGFDANGHVPILLGTSSCVISVGSGIVNASFTIGNVLPGQYTIEITGCGGNNGCTPSVGDFAQAILNVVSGPAIKLSPATGQPGTHVLVNGTGFLPTDQSCTISAVGLDANGHSPLLSGTAACVIRAGSGLVNASFTIGNVLPGQYIIEITGCLGNNGCTPSAGDFAQALLNVVSGPKIRLSPATGQPGAHIAVNGTGFLPTDTSCTLSTVGLDANGHSAILSGTAGCAISVGSGIVNASFTIGNVLPGQYVIEITGCLGNNGCTPSVGDFAQAVLNVVSGPEIKLSPATGSPGFDILVNGTGFLPTDQSCSISGVGLDANGHSAIFGGSASCVVRVGSGVVNGSFTIGNVLPGQYVIEITGCLGNNGCSPSVGDFAQANLKVVGGPRLTLSPGTGMIGQEILVNGTGFLSTDQSCSVSSPSTPDPILPGSSGCAIAVGTGLVNASFVIGTASPGQYVIEITGCLGNNGCAPSAGDFAQAVLAVIPGTSEIDIFPTNATTGATVVVRAYGLSTSDTGCLILAYSGDITPAHLDNTLITSSTCSIVTPQTAQGTFVVAPYATEDINWNVTIKGTPANDIVSASAGHPIGASFGVTASITVVPTSGTINTVFTYTGTGFESDATTCNATVIPAFAGSTVKPSCAIDPFGQVSGSVLVPSTAIAGTYAIEVVDSTGSRGSAVFTVGTPSALVVLNPASVEQGQSVGVAGTGFNAQDAYCTISSPASTNLFATGTTPTCLISSGYASGSFMVASNAAGGYYLITIQACSVAPSANVCPPGDGRDFASNFLGVTLATTITTYSTTTSSSSTTTGFTFTTTSVATSFSYSSTTVQTTGILYTTYSHFILTTVSGVTSTTYSVTSYTTQTQTTVTYSTTTQFTTVPCGPLPCGFSTQPAPFNPAPGIDSAGLLAALLLLIPMLLRRLFT
ncbi:MAG: hypothetical protein ABSF63_00005 [Candidatus Bathyarchaeia archaeon]